VLTLILIAAAALVIYALFVLVRPTKVCGRCHGDMVIVRGTRVKPCKRCKDGRRYRPGATAVHRFAWSVIGDRLMAARRAGDDQ
jgi:hypothetical protein